MTGRPSNAQEVAAAQIVNKKTLNKYPKRCDIDLDYDVLFYETTWCLKMFGGYAYSTYDLKWFIRFIILHGLFTFCAVCTFCMAIFYDLKKGDVAVACSNLSLDIVYLYNSFSFFVLLKYKPTFAVLIETIKHDYDVAKTLPLEEQYVVKKYAKRSRWVLQSWKVLVISFFNLMITKPIAMTLYYKFFGRFRYVYALKLTFPGKLEEIKNTLPMYACTVFFYTFVDLYSTLLYLGVSPLGPAYMLHACGQLEILKIRVKQLFCADSNLNNEDRMNKLKSIAKTLQKIYDFVEQIQIGFKLLYEITLKGTAFILPVLGYQIIDAYRKHESMLEFTTGLVVGALALSGYPCYYGSQLIETGRGLTEAVYMSGWETHWDKQLRITLLLLLTRMTKTLAIRSLFRTICLDALTDVFHQAYSIYNVMNAFWN